MAVSFYENLLIQARNSRSKIFLKWHGLLFLQKSMAFNISELLTVTFTLFAVIDVIGSIPAGSGTLTTIMSLKANHGETTLLVAILVNLALVYVVLKSLRYIERLLGPSGLIAVRKFFGVILLAIAVKIFTTNAHGLIK